MVGKSSQQIPLGRLDLNQLRRRLMREDGLRAALRHAFGKQTELVCAYLFDKCGSRPVQWVEIAQISPREHGVSDARLKGLLQEVNNVARARFTGKVVLFFGIVLFIVEPQPAIAILD